MWVAYGFCTVIHFQVVAVINFQGVRRWCRGSGRENTLEWIIILKSTVSCLDCGSALCTVLGSVEVSRSDGDEVSTGRITVAPRLGKIVVVSPCLLFGVPTPFANAFARVSP